MQATMPALPPLSAMRAFEAAARLLSFTRAGAELGMSQAAVSWQVKALEQRLGVPLFERRRTGLVLTSTGRALLPDVSHALTCLRQAFDGVDRRGAAPATLRISASPTFAHLWLAPRLGAFHGRYPEIFTQVEASPDLADVAAGAADVAIRRGKGSWPGLTGHHLMPVMLVPLCAPGLIGSAEALSVADILRLPRLQPAGVWRHWLAQVGADPGLVSGRTAARYLNQHMVVQAAIAGQGVALLHPAFCAEALDQRRLVRAHPETFVSNQDGYWLVHRSGRVLDAVTHFRDWLLSELPAEPGQKDAAYPA